MRKQFSVITNGQTWEAFDLSSNPDGSPRRIGPKHQTRKDALTAISDSVSPSAELLITSEDRYDPDLPYDTVTQQIKRNRAAEHHSSAQHRAACDALRDCR